MDAASEQLIAAKSANRIEWVDLCKGFAMILVLIGHSYAPQWLHTWLYSFHMPLFFFLSGYVFSVRKYPDFRSFLRAKLRTLFLPACGFGMLTSIIKYCLQPDGSFAVFLLKKSAAIFIQLRGSTDYDLGLWFFTYLFVVEIAFWFLLKLTNEKMKPIVLLLTAAAAVGYLYHVFIGGIVPWSLDAACIAIGFFGAGYLIRQYGQNVLQKVRDWRTGIALLGINILLTWLQNDVFHVETDIYAQEYGVPLLFHLAAFSGLLASICLFSNVKKLRFLSFLGKNTFLYYAFHGTVFSVLALLLEKTIGKSYGFSVLKIVLTIFVCAGICTAVNHYAPWMLGKSKGENKT